MTTIRTQVGWKCLLCVNKYPKFEEPFNFSPGTSHRHATVTNPCINFDKSMQHPGIHVTSLTNPTSQVPQQAQSDGVTYWQGKVMVALGSDENIWGWWRRWWKRDAGDDDIHKRLATVTPGQGFILCPKKLTQPSWLVGNASHLHHLHLRLLTQPKTRHAPYVDNDDVVVAVVL